MLSDAHDQDIVLAFGNLINVAEAVSGTVHLDEDATPDVEMFDDLAAFVRRIATEGTGFQAADICREAAALAEELR